MQAKIIMMIAQFLIEMLTIWLKHKNGELVEATPKNDSLA